MNFEGAVFSAILFTFLQKIMKATKGGMLSLDFPTSGSFKPPTLVASETETTTKTSTETSKNGQTVVTETTTVVTKSQASSESPIIETTTTTETHSTSEVR